MEIDPDYGEVYFNYGNLLSDERKFGEAAIRYLKLKTGMRLILFICCSYEKAIVYPQMYAKTLNNLATMYFRLGEGVTYNYCNIFLSFVFSKSPYMLGRHKEAEDKYLESVQVTPDQASTYNNLGISLFLYSIHTKLMILLHNTKLQTMLWHSNSDYCAHFSTHWQLVFMEN